MQQRPTPNEEQACLPLIQSHMYVDISSHTQSQSRHTSSVHGRNGKAGSGGKREYGKIPLHIYTLRKLTVTSVQAMLNLRLFRLCWTWDWSYKLGSGKDLAYKRIIGFSWYLNWNNTKAICLTKIRWLKAKVNSWRASNKNASHVHISKGWLFNQASS